MEMREEATALQNMTFRPVWGGYQAMPSRFWAATRATRYMKAAAAAHPRLRWCIGSSSSNQCGGRRCGSTLKMGDEMLPAVPRR